MRRLSEPIARWFPIEGGANRTLIIGIFDFVAVVSVSSDADDAVVVAYECEI